MDLQVFMLYSKHCSKEITVHDYKNTALLQRVTSHLNWIMTQYNLCNLSHNDMFTPLNHITSICILRCCLKLERSVTKIASDSSNTFGTEDTPFLDSATHRYCLMALINISFVWNTGPAFWRMDNNSCSDSTFDRSSCDLSNHQTLKIKNTFLKHQKILS